MRIFIFISLLLSLGLQASLSFAMGDPTRPLNYRIPIHNAKKGFQLNSILASASRQVAIINGKLVQVGNLINGATVTRIATQAVWLRKNGKTFAIQLPQVRGIR